MTRWANAVDAALEWSVVGSFTRVGSAWRRRTAKWTPLTDYRMDGRVVVITGATSGLGLQTARTLASMGATLELVARDAAKARVVAEEIARESGNGNIGVVIAEMGDLDAVKRAAAELQRRHTKLDVLILNAGALDDVRRESPQGLEQTVASQVVGPSLFTSLLVPQLAAAAPSRVLWVSSGGMYSEPLAVDALAMPAEGYDGTTAYARAKRAQVTLAELWAARLQGQGIFVHAMHPGWADTPGVARSLPRFRRVVGPLLRSPAEGADTLLWLACDNGAPLQATGKFWHDRHVRSPHRLASTRRADTEDAREALWQWVAAKGGYAAHA